MVEPLTERFELDGDSAEGIHSMATTSTGGGRAAASDRGAAIRPHVFPPFLIHPGSAGDHPAIFKLLRSVFHQPTPSGFNAQLEDPFYEPTDRIIAKRHRDVVGHALITKREMYFGDLRIPFAGLRDLATLPEYRRQGLGAELLDQAERQMKADNAFLGVLSTSQPGFFQRRGWSVWPEPSYTLAGAREILSLIRAQIPEPRIFPGAPDPTAPCNIRLQRAVEMPALQRLYDDFANGLIGPTVRTEATWRWLSGGSEDRIYVAIQGPDRLELDDEFADIVGYAVVRGGVLMELVTGDDPFAGRRLLERVCGDAIEHDRELIRLEAPPHDPLHEFAREAGGRVDAAVGDGQVSMVKVLQLDRLVELLEPRFSTRVREAGLGPKCDLGVVIDGKRYRLSVNRRKVRFTEDNIGRSYITCSRRAFEQLLLGYWRIEDALAQGVVNSSTRVATERAKVLFPKLSVWRPSFDDGPGVG